MCLHVSHCVRTHYTDAHMCEGQESTLMSSSVVSPLFFEIKSLTEPATHQFDEGDWPLSPTDPFASVIPARGVQVHVLPLHYYVSSGDRTQVPMLAWQTLS